MDSGKKQNGITTSATGHISFASIFLGSLNPTTKVQHILIRRKEYADLYTNNASFDK